MQDQRQMQGELGRNKEIGAARRDARFVDGAEAKLVAHEISKPCQVVLLTVVWTLASELMRPMKLSENSSGDAEWRSV